MSQAHHTSMGVDNRKMAFWAFIGSECLLFGSLISTYLIYKGKSLVGPYPHDVLNIPFTSFSTFDLLMSSLAMVLALAAIQRGDLKQAKLWLFVTALLGLVFLGGQVYEFSSFVHEGLGLTTNLFGSTFFVLTGTHGAHVTVGVIWLLTLWVQALRGKLGPKQAIRGNHRLVLALRRRRVDRDLHPRVPDSMSGGQMSEQAHASTGTYLRIAAILVMITLIEVGVFYVPAFQPVLVPVLLVLSAVKFALVVLFYMHLRFDSRLFAFLFSGPLLLAVGVMIGLLFLFFGAVRLRTGT